MTDQTLAKLSLFTSHNAKAVGKFITMQELAQMAAGPCIGAKAAAPLLTPYQSTAKTLDAAQAAQYAAIVVDHDHDNRTADDIRQIYGPNGFNVAYLAFTTSSHTEAAPRWKVVVPFACPVDADTTRRLSAGLAYSLAADPVQARKQQGFYAPNKLKPDSDYQHIDQLGEQWEWLQPDDADSVFIQEATQGWTVLQELEQQAQTAQAKPRPTSTSGTIIEQILQAYDLTNLLEHHGYKRKGKGLYLSPFSSSGMAGVRILQRDGKQVVYSHHGPACPLSAENHGGHALDVADVLAVLEYQGNFDRMIKEQANLLDEAGQKQRQREYMQEQQRKAEAFNAPPEWLSPDDDSPWQPEQQEQQHRLTRFIDIGAKPEPPDWILPGFIAEGVALFAGGHGVGKTTTMLPLALAAAGVHPPDYPLAPKPDQWRHVIYITEDTAQARRIITGYGEYLDWPGGRGVPERIQERLHVVEAVRDGAGHVAQAGAYYRQHYSRTVTTTGLDGREYTAELLPLVVIDTLAATIHLVNENDNAEASAAMAALKQQFAGLPIWIIAHTAKANLSRAEGITARGASAFEADAQQVLYLVNDGDKGRWLMRGKTRFESPWQELEIHSDSRTMTAVNRFGAEESLTLRWAVAVPPEGGSKAERQEQIKADRAERDRDALRVQILQTVREAFENSKRYNRAGLKSKISGNGQAKADAIAELLNDGWLFEVEVPKAERIRNKPSFLVALDEAEREAFTTTGEIPAHKLTIPPDWKKPAAFELEPEQEAG